MLFHTTWTAAPVIALAAALGVNVSLQRMGRGLGLKAAPDEALLRAQRAHGNLVEHAPLVLVGLPPAELAGPGRTPLLALGLGFVAARLLHAVGLLARMKPLSFTGATLTYVVEAGVAVLLITRA